MWSDKKQQFVRRCLRRASHTQSPYKGCPSLQPLHPGMTALTLESRWQSPAGSGLRRCRCRFLSVVRHRPLQAGWVCLWPLLPGWPPQGRQTWGRRPFWSIFQTRQFTAGPVICIWHNRKNWRVGRVPFRPARSIVRTGGQRCTASSAMCPCTKMRRNLRKGRRRPVSRPLFGVLQDGAVQTSQVQDGSRHSQHTR